MSVFPRNRVFLFAAALLAAAQALLAGTPSARTQARMVFDPTTSSVIMFGGQSPFDKGTAKSYDLDETWLWNGSRWVQHYSNVTPPARSAFAMVWDSKRSRALLFGGKQGATELGDTWVYRNGEWSAVDTPNA
ncbi:MAG TPA: hypothetical protein VN181_01130, partial [Thermoanaerobaculia bacterium]|nr:hypothetical protein [Thermoanaerobaculia bacterium]